MAPVAQYAKFPAKPGLGGKVKEALNDAAEAAANEAGTLVYVIHETPDDPDTIWMYELYDSPESQVAHSSSEATGRLRAAVADLLDGPLTVSKGVPVRAQGLPGGV
jgi:quinol monooxygenase YgiN